MYMIKGLRVLLLDNMMRIGVGQRGSGFPEHCEGTSVGFDYFCY
jgi:hypothetical protein